MSYRPPPPGGPPGGFPHPPPYGGQDRPYGSPYGPGQYPVMAPEHPRAATILVLGILSIVFCPIMGPFAWSMGNSALNEIERSGGAIGGRSNVNAGRICGIVGTAFLTLSFVYIFFLLALVSIA